MKFAAMMAMAVTIAMGLRAQEADPIVEALDKREVIESLMTIFRQASLDSRHMKPPSA